MLVNLGSDMCVDVTDGSTSNGTNLQQWGCGGADYQKWNISGQGNDQFALISKSSGLAVDGYASISGPDCLSTTTGGGSATPTTVSTCEALIAAASDSSARVIQIPNETLDPTPVSWAARSY